MTAKHHKVILFIETSSAYGRGLLRGIAEYSKVHGPWSFYSEDGGLATKWPHLDEWGADGIITRDLGANQRVLKMGIPTIFRLDERLLDGSENMSILTTNSEAIGKMAAEFYLDRGFKNFAYCGFNNTLWSVKRGESFAGNIAQAGFKTIFYKSPTTKKGLLWDKEQTALAKWLETLPMPCAVMACNDKRARHVIEASKISGITVPDSVAVLGVDDDDFFCELSNPSISSIALNTERAGYEAAELLERLMSGSQAQNNIIMVQPTVIKERRSTDTVVSDDCEVSAALRYISNNSGKLLQVSDVAEAVGLSRRVLEKRFLHYLNRSVYYEIQRTRVERISKLLLETDKSIHEIAIMCGLASEKHLSRMFLKIKGLTPRQFRSNSRLK